MPLFYNRTGVLHKFKKGANAGVQFTSRDDCIFCGSEYLKEYLSEITIADIQKLYPQQAQEVWDAIQELEFGFPHKEGDQVNANTPLITITGNPVAIELVSSMVMTVIGGQTAQASIAKYFTMKAPKCAFSYQGYRRGPTNEASIDYAASKGGFASAANILNALNKTRRRFIKSQLPVRGTIAHAWITSITTIHKLAISDNKLSGLCDALSITIEQYNDVKKNKECDINDYVAFAAYITAVKAIESKILARDGKSDPKSVVLLVDTTSTEKGIHSAIQAAIDTKRAITGIRLDTTPEKFIVMAWNLLQVALKGPGAKFVENAKIFCTDGIDQLTLDRIMVLCKLHNIPEDRLAFGIGSTIANTPAIKLRAEKFTSVVNTSTFCLKRDTPHVDGKYVPVNEVDEYNLVRLAADFYAQTQDDYLHEFNKRLRSNGVAELTEMVSHLNFRHREPPAQNYLVVAGLDQTLRILDNFRFDKDFIDMMKASGLSYTDKEYNDLFKDQKLKVKIDCVKEGSIIGPYSPILSITGDPGHVLLVESFLLSTIGCMSAVATKANELVHSLDYSLQDLIGLNIEARRRICNVYGVNELIANNPNDMFEVLKTSDTATFVYWGDNERTLSTYRSNAAFVGGFKESTMQQNLGIPVTEIGINFKDYAAYDATERERYNTVCIDLPYLIEEYSKFEYLKLLKDKECIQIRGDFNKEVMLLLHEKLLQHNIPLSKVKFIVREPLANAENLKGTVYKAGALRLQYIDGHGIYMSGMKAAGNTTKGGVKSSIPGVDQKLMVLKDKNDKAIAVMIIDLNLLPIGIKSSSEDDIKNYILESMLQPETQPVLYYNYGKDQAGVFKYKDAAVDLGTYSFDRSNPPVKIDFITRKTIETSANFKKPKTQDASSTLRNARQTARSDFKHDYHKLPVLMDKGMSDKLHSLLQQGDAANTDEVPRSRVRQHYL